MTPRPKTSTKSKYHVALEADVMKTLKHLAVEYNKPIGDIIEGLLDLAEAAPAPLVETCLVNAGRESGNIVPYGVDPLAHAVMVEEIDARDQKTEMLREQKQLKGPE